MYQIRVCTQEATMENREENDASTSPRGEGPAEDPLEQPRDLDELLLWHQELALGPDYVKLAPEDKRKKHRDAFRLETQGLEAHLKWNQLVEYFSSQLIQHRGLESEHWRSNIEDTDLPCAGEDAISANNLSLRSIAMCRVHKSLKHLSRHGYGTYFTNYRVQRPILDLLPIPRNVIDDLIVLWDSCARHRDFCGLSPVGISWKCRILVCPHKKAGEEDRTPICKEQKCRMYHYLRRTQCWSADYNKYLTEPWLLSEVLKKKLQSRGYPAKKMLRIAAKIGMQMFYFSE